MTDNDEPNSFGFYLQSKRVARGLTLAQLSQETRIREEILRYIEAEAHAQLPDPVFVRGFLRAYAEAVGVEPQEALRRYSQRQAVQRRLPTSGLDTAHPAESFWLKLGVSLAAIFLIAGIALFVEHWRQQRSLPAAPGPAMEASPAPATAAAPAQTSEALPEPAAARAPSPSPATQPAPEAAAAPPVSRPAPTPQYKLVIHANEATWLKIIADAEPAREILLQADETVAVEAVSAFNLLIGNAGGVDLTLNGQPVTVPGRTGQVVTLQLP
jgi:cytoskeleton protein RodZ